MVGLQTIEMRRLSEAGLVSVRDDPRGGARRHCYTLTQAGRQALTEWLTDPSEPALEMRNEALLRLQFAGVLDPKQRVAVVRRMQAVHDQRVAELQQQLDADEFDDPFHRMTVEYGLGFNEWASEWCENAQRRLASAEPPPKITRSG